MVAIGLASACTGEVSCGASKKIDGRKAEKFLRDHYKKSATRVGQIKCPDGLKKKKGATFICHVTAENGDVIKAEFTQTDGDGYVEVTKMESIVSGQALMVELRKLAKENKTTSELELSSIECPKDQKAVKGKTFECQGKIEDGFVLFQVELTDDEGTVNFRFSGRITAATKLAAILKAGLKEKKIEADVDCGAKPLRLIDKRVVECKALDKNKKEATIEVIPQGPHGSFDWRVKK